MAGEWISQLPDDLKGNEAFTAHETLGDFAKAHLETAGKVTTLDGNATELTGKVTDLEGKLANSIPKLSETSTTEDKAAFQKALGVPEKSSDYEFSAAEGVEHDPKMMDWARDTFHKANLSQEQVGIIQPAWDMFVDEIGKAHKQAQETAEAEAKTKLKTDWGSDYDKNMELTKRAWNHFTGSSMDEFSIETGVGNHPVLTRFVFNVGQAMGEDFSLKGKPGGPKDTVAGIVYDMPDFK